jgi:uncharacterized protein (DUF433 family)
MFTATARNSAEVLDSGANSSFDVTMMGGHSFNGKGVTSMSTRRRKILGRHIVIDPGVCHGKPTFRGTRIMVAQVLKQVARGMPWDAISAEWRGAVSKEAIAEAVELAQRIFEAHAVDYALESQPA